MGCSGHLVWEDIRQAMSSQTVRFMNRSTPPHLITLVTMAGVSAMAMNMFLPSMADMAQDFETQYSVIQLTVTLYLVMNAAFQFVFGPFSDRYGRRPVLLVAMVVFCIGSAMAVVAQDVTVLLIARGLQAGSVAGLVLSRAAIRDMYDTDKAASMMGYMTMCMAVLPMISPAIGGWLSVQFGWVSNFWVMLFAGLLVLGLSWADMGETNNNKSKSFGAQFRTYPELFRSPRFWAYCMSAASAVGAYFAYLGGGAFVGSNVFGLPTETLGIYFGAPAVGYLIGNGLSGKFSTRFGLNNMILAGALVAVVGLSTSLLLLNIIENPSPLVFFGSITFVGIGNGLTLPNAMSGMMSVRPHLGGSASGIGGTIMTGGGALLAAFTGAILQPGMDAGPLVTIMLITSTLPLFGITFIKRREAQQGPLD